MNIADLASCFDRASAAWFTKNNPDRHGKVMKSRQRKFVQNHEDSNELSGGLFSVMLRYQQENIDNQFICVGLHFQRTMPTPGPAEQTHPHTHPF